MIWQPDCRIRDLIVSPPLPITAPTCRLGTVIVSSSSELVVVCRKRHARRHQRVTCRCSVLATCAAGVVRWANAMQAGSRRASTGQVAMYLIQLSLQVSGDIRSVDRLLRRWLSWSWLEQLVSGRVEVWQTTQISTLFDKIEHQFPVATDRIHL